MRVREIHDDGRLKAVELVDEDGPVEVACRFLQYLSDRNFSPNTWRAYGYDLRYLFMFLEEQQLSWQEFMAPTAMDFLSFMRRQESRKSAQRFGLTVIVGGEDGDRRLSPATVHRVLAGVSSFYDWASAVGLYSAESPMERHEDLALARVPDRHQPFTGGASRQRPMRRAVTVKRPLRLPRPLDDDLVEALLTSMTCLRDLAVMLLMLDGGLRPGEVLSLHLQDISYGHRRVVVRKRDDHPRGARPKSRSERVVDLQDPRTLEAVSRYVMGERPVESDSPFVFLVGGNRKTRCEPLSYDAVARMFARRMTALGRRTPDTTPHALRHTHATAMWEGGMRELTLQKRLGHASPESTRVYTRVSDETVLTEYARALESRR
ncbi:tyrosine-type recombinase/integrase [Kribbella qitaiheensis]|uniref:Tyrosine-type recombinase/integrase n=1 Tax=Kribbella qitaiheensis TaxID=1544730 RepID=A0A7G6WW42_9ACTN|nr:tyrosine-type recombinase/integrase [Kribbella qitaiheensis]QNE18207.1 tyrosine-type recombinase/integrase [Kribbella qitaiheensis]